MHVTKLEDVPKRAQYHENTNLDNQHEPTDEDDDQFIEDTKSLPQ